LPKIHNMENNILDADIYGTERTAAEIMEILRQKGYIDVYENNSGAIVVNAAKTLACTIAQDKTGKWQPIIEPRYFIPEIFIPCILLIFLLNFINVKLGVLLSLAITSGVTWLFTTNKRKRLKADIQIAIHGS